jgi:hypothetical protein
VSEISVDVAAADFVIRFVSKIFRGHVSYP